MVEPGTTGAPADSPSAPPDFSAYERDANSADLARTTPPTTPADPSPAPAPGDPPAPAGDAAPPPATPDDKKPKNLQTRGPELDKEITDLQEKLKLRRALREELARTDRPGDAKPAASSPATPTAPEWQRYRTHPDAPKADDFDTYEDFVAAQSVFIADKRFEERDQRATLERQSHERVSATQQTITGFHERLATARAADPDFDTKVDPGLLQVVPAFALRSDEPIRPANVLLQEVVGSEVSNELLVHFSTPEGQKEWGALASALTLPAMLRLFGRVEARFLTHGAAAEPTAPAKPVTSAPAPPTTLGTRPPASPDRAGAAVKAGDYSAYEAAQDAADLAVRRR